MHDMSGLGVFMFGIVAIPLGAILAAVFAGIAYRKRALKQYWFVILSSYFVPWLVVAAARDTDALEFFRELTIGEPGDLRPWFAAVPLIGVALFLAGCHYFARYLRERRNLRAGHI